MTTPNGTPSVAPSPRDLNEGLQDPTLCSTYASAKGGGQYTGSGEPRPQIVGMYTDDVEGRFTEGATVSNDQTGLNPVGTQPAP